MRCVFMQASLSGCLERHGCSPLRSEKNVGGRWIIYRLNSHDESFEGSARC
jgi:hypothetical protein